MNKNEVRIEALRRLELIEERFIDSHVPSDVMSLYMLLKLIHSADFGEYFAEFGFRAIRPGDINDAKLDLGWGSISDFEREVCDLLQKRCDERLRTQNKVVHVRALAQ